MFFVILVGLGLRLLFINKPDGLWNDEYVSWMIANQPLFNGFWHAVKSQCHMPLYYLYLKFFMLFSSNDLILRLSSVISGFISIIAMYFVGLEKDKKTGLLLTLFTSVSSFLIYYSQEVRPYSLIFLFSALSLFFTLKLVKNPDKKNLVLLSLFNILIIFTHTIGFLYVFFNLIYISFKLFRKWKSTIIKLWFIVFLGVILACPLVVKIFTTQSFSQWWASFHFANWGFLFTDYFSPILTNLVSAPESFFFNMKIGYLIFAWIPTLIALYFIVKAIKSDKDNLFLFLITVGIVFVMTIAALMGKLVFITKYSIEIYPILLFLAAYGCMLIDNKILRRILISVYCIIHVFYIAISPISAPKVRRAQGHKIVADMIQRAEPQKNDYIILEYYDKDRFEKYFDFSNYKIVSINKGNFTEYLSQNMDYKKALTEGKVAYRPTFMATKNGYLEEKINKDVIKNLKKNQNIILVSLDSVALYSPQKLIEIASDDNLYNKSPLLFMVFSHLKYQLVQDLYENLAITRYETKGEWSLMKFTKLKN